MKDLLFFEQTSQFQLFLKKYEISPLQLWNSLKEMAEITNNLVVLNSQEDAFIIHLSKIMKKNNKAK